MDQLLCDELIQEIFIRLPSSSSSSVSLVSKRWLHLYRTSISSLSLTINPNNSSSIPSFLSHYPHLCSLTIVSDTSSPIFSSPLSQSNLKTYSSDDLLISVGSNCSNLHLFRFFAGPISSSSSSLVSLSSSCKHLTSLHLSSFRPLSFCWLTHFPFLKDLSFTNSGNKFDEFTNFNSNSDDEEALFSPNSSGLPLENLCLSGIGPEDHGMGWLWRNCKNLQKLQLKNCEGIGDDNSSSYFFNCLKGLQELELRTSRTIVDEVLMQLTQHCDSLKSLLVYDGGSRDGLHQFITRTRSSIKRLDFRLPLDLNNNHLSEIAENFRDLISLRLQSCCLVTGEGLKNFGSAMNQEGIEELALINCDVIEREIGLLTSMGQNLRGLKKLDLSFNEMLLDKELISMLVSCKNLMDIKLRGCRGITNSAMISLCKNCKFVVNLDIKQCCGIGEEGVEFVLMNLPKLRKIQIEDFKVSCVAKTWVSQKVTEIC